MTYTPWTETEKAQIRLYLGYSSLFFTSNTRLENAINTVQTITVGGQGQTEATMAVMRTALARLADIDAKINALYCSLQVVEAGEEKVKVNAVRAIYMLRSEGKKTIAQLAIPLGCAPIRDYYAGVDVKDDTYSNVFDAPYINWDLT